MKNYLKIIKKFIGNVKIVGMFILDIILQKNVQFVNTHKNILSVIRWGIEKLLKEVWDIQNLN